MMRSHQLVPLLLTVVAATADTSVAPQRPTYASHWRAGEVVVDGSASEWEGLTTPVTDLQVSIGAANDAEMLHLCLLSDDPGTRELILRRGLIVWFDPAGGTKKVFGLRYPVGTFSVDKPRPLSRGRAAARDAPPEPIEIVNRVELLGPGSDERRSLLADKVPGIRVKIGQSGAGMTYELEVPLSWTAGRPYSIGARPGAVVGIGLETPDLEKGVTVTGEPPRGDARGRGWSVGGGGSGGRAAEFARPGAGTDAEATQVVGCAQAGHRRHSECARQRAACPLNLSDARATHVRHVRAQCACAMFVRHARAPSGSRASCAILRSA